MNPRALFFVTFISAPFDYYEVRKKHVLFDPIDGVAKKYWNKIVELAKKVKEARKVKERGIATFKRVIKWAAKPHHIQDLLKIVEKKGEATAGEMLYKHAIQHHLI